MRNQTVEKPLKSSLELAVVPGGVYGRCRTIAAAENAIFQSKSWQGLAVAGSGGGACLPVHRLVKTFLPSRIPVERLRKFLCSAEISIASHGAQGENLRKTDAEEEIGTDKTIRADLLCVKTQLIPK